MIHLCKRQSSGCLKACRCFYLRSLCGGAGCFSNSAVNEPFCGKVIFEDRAGVRTAGGVPADHEYVAGCPVFRDEPADETVPVMLRHHVRIVERPYVSPEPVQVFVHPDKPAAVLFRTDYAYQFIGVPDNVIPDRPRKAPLIIIRIKGDQPARPGDRKAGKPVFREITAAVRIVVLV